MSLAIENIGASPSTGSLVDWKLKGLGRLETLCLTFTDSRHRSHCFESLPRLRSLKLSSSAPDRAMPQLPKTITCLANLSSLSLERVCLAADSTANVANLPTLSSLTIKDSTLTWPASLRAMGNLQHLAVHSTDLPSFAFRLTSFTSLRSLQLSHMSGLACVLDEDLPSCAQLTSLERVITCSSPTSLDSA